MVGRYENLLSSSLALLLFASLACSEDASLHLLFLEHFQAESITPPSGYPTRVRHWTRACKTYMNDPAPSLE